MRQKNDKDKSLIKETIRGIIERVTFHNPDTGWSVLRVKPIRSPNQMITVIVHQTKVFAGATMRFRGIWKQDDKYGYQFRALEAIEEKPASTAALEKYLGSGLIKGVRAKTAQKIVNHFGEETLKIFEGEIERLTEIPGIAKKKLETIKKAWEEHRSIRDVMIFLQSHGISTLFATRIYKEYGDKAIQYVSEDPYTLARDFFGIGFFSADKVALSIGIKADSPERIKAAINHVLAASRDDGHCYLTESQIAQAVINLLKLNLRNKIPDLLNDMEKKGQLVVRNLVDSNGLMEKCFYSKSLYFDELFVANRIKNTGPHPNVDQERVFIWIDRFCKAKSITLSNEQIAAIRGIVSQNFSVLTGGPGCGKTTTTFVLVKLLEAMGLKVLLAAPTGRAAQRMTDVIGKEAKTIHRLLEWRWEGFQKNQNSQLKVDFLIVDECSMLDINLTASLLKATPNKSQVLFIGDPDQLPSVGAGNVLKDLINSKTVPCFRLTKIFRQAKKSLIVKYAHQINNGKIPHIGSPINKPNLWKQKSDCFFIDSEEATKEQINFIKRTKELIDIKRKDIEDEIKKDNNLFEFRIKEDLVDPYKTEFSIPSKFKHVNIIDLYLAENEAEELKVLLKKIHPWSSLHFDMSASKVIEKLYLDWIPKYYGENCEIQILSPMTKGSLGTINLNKLIQDYVNPANAGKKQISLGEKIFREGDRVIHRHNNYDLGVFNGDIGIIHNINIEKLTCEIYFPIDKRIVLYKQADIVELDLAYAITIHKSQGSEFEIIIIPILTQHFKMLFRNLIYTGLTRAKNLAVLVGTRKALALSVQNQFTGLRQTALELLLKK